MPISDLLASITGQSSSAPASKPAPPRVNSFPKRRADDELRNETPKTPRTFTSQAKPAQSSRPLDKPSSSSASKPLVGASKPSVLSSKPMNSANRVTKPQSTSRPSPTATLNGTATTPVAKVAPKKGSYAEIMARASKAQQVMGQVGRIQHKKVEGGMIKKEKETKAEQKPTPGKRPPGYSGSSSNKPTGPLRNGGTSAREGTNGGSRPRPDTAPARPKLSAKQQAEIDREQERKLKKLSQVSSYSGTSRGKPPSSSSSSNKRPNAQAARGGALLSAPKVRPSKGSSRYEDDYDEDMDDFIDYDEEEEEGGTRYGYASDGSSDMEAGLDDIDGEERRAERLARQEDLEEQRLEMSLKNAKEERKRRALEELRASRRR